MHSLPLFLKATAIERDKVIADFDVSTTLCSQGARVNTAVLKPEAVPLSPLDDRILEILSLLTS